jgi:hypothetical protein
MSDHYTTFQDVFIGNDGVRVEFSYTKAMGNRWHVVASIVRGYVQTEIYSAYDEKPESIEELFTTHRAAVAQLLTALARLVGLKGLMQ